MDFVLDVFIFRSIFEQNGSLVKDSFFTINFCLFFRCDKKIKYRKRILCQAPVFDIWKKCVKL